MLNRATAVTDGTGPFSLPALSRRRSSLLSNGSDTRFSHSSTDNLLRSNGKGSMTGISSSDEPTYWISIPVVAAIVPAIVGLTYENGATIATDLLILGMAAWFLHWCVSVPWHWYHAAQERHLEYSEVSSAPYDDEIREEDHDVMESTEEPTGSSEKAKEKDSQTDGYPDCNESLPVTNIQEIARKALRREELTSLAACFIGPLLGAVLLHQIRGQLARTEGIVSDFNLVIFVMFAEFRPLKQLIKLRDEKIWHLQRIVRMEPHDQTATQHLAQRIADLEARMEGSLPGNGDIIRMSEKVAKSTQLQIDGLTRAVRRYEKRAMSQTLQMEARFEELEIRLRDALSLAAAAARTGQKPGILALSLHWIMGTIKYTYETVLHVTLYPFRATASSLAYLESFFVRGGRQPRKKIRASEKAYSPMSTSRIHSKVRQ